MSAELTGAPTGRMGGANANGLARQAADRHARTFDCNNHPLVIGTSGRAIELSRP